MVLESFQRVCFRWASRSKVDKRVGYYAAFDRLSFASVFSFYEKHARLCINRIPSAFAKSARETLEAGKSAGLEAPFDKFPHSADLVTSELLGRYMQQALGLAPLVIDGSLRDAGYDRMVHSWLRVGNTIIDLTADQFELPSVIVTADSAFHSWRRKRLPDPPRREAQWDSYPLKAWQFLVPGFWPCR